MIEDNQDLADTLRELIENWGHTVEIATTGPAGVAAMERFRPRIVLCDIGLPELDGYGVARAILDNRPPELRWIVAVSGYAGEEDRVRALAAGFDGHLTKPVNLKQLRQLLTETSPEEGGDQCVSP